MNSTARLELEPVYSTRRRRRPNPLAAVVAVVRNAYAAQDLADRYLRMSDARLAARGMTREQAIGEVRRLMGADTAGGR